MLVVTTGGVFPKEYLVYIVLTLRPAKPSSPHLDHTTGLLNAPQTPFLYFLCDTHSYLNVEVTPCGLSVHPSGIYSISS